MTKTRDDYSEELESEYRRVERAYERVLVDFDGLSFSKSGEASLDSVFEFCQAAFHLREWVNLDPKVSKEIKEKVPVFIDKGLEPGDISICLPICKDLANLKKHRVFDPKCKFKPNDLNIRIEPAGSAVFRASGKDVVTARASGSSVHLKNEDALFIGSIVITYKGHKYEARGTVECCMYHWKTFFTDNDLLMPRIF